MLTRSRRLIAAFAIAAFAILAGTAEAATENRIALVVGNARYPDAPLKNAANDARAMATTLRERGFNVILRVDANKTQMETAIIEFGEKLSEGATGLFFFAGHGMQVQGRNYIVPVDAKLSTEQRIKLEAVDVDAVLDQMQGARSKVNVVILDACRNNPFERRFRSASGGLAQINAPEGTLIAYATAPGRVAADGEGANGLYTAELLKALRAPGLKVEDVFKQVRINVARASNGAQTPWEASSLVGDFYFIPPEPSATASSNTAELEFWNTIRGSNEAAEYRAYLNRYPNGEFREIAQMRMAAIENSLLSAAAKPPMAAPALGRSLNGTYETSISGASWTIGDIAAVIEINGSRVSGTAVRPRQPRPCPIVGTIATDGTLTSPLRIDCDRVWDREEKFDSLTILLEGRFSHTADGQHIVGETVFRSSDRRTGSVTWRSPEARVAVASARTRPERPVAADHASSASISKPSQQAALSPPSAPISGVDGIYNAKFTMIGTTGFLDLDAAIEIVAGKVLGKATSSSNAPDSCTLSGSVDPATGDVGSLFMACRWLTAHFRGRFVVDPGSGRIVGRTEARAVSDGRVVPVVWRP